MIRQKIEALQHTIKVFIRKGETHYVAECLEIPVVTQGKTTDETIENLWEAVSLHLEDEDCLVSNPTLIITMEVEPLSNVA